jgi:hypothetical protein
VWNTSLLVILTADYIGLLNAFMDLPRRSRS